MALRMMSRGYQREPRVSSIAARAVAASTYFARKFACRNQSIQNSCAADVGVPRFRGHLRTRITPRTVSTMIRFANDGPRWLRGMTCVIFMEAAGFYAVTKMLSLIEAP